MGRAEGVLVMLAGSWGRGGVDLVEYYHGTTHMLISHSHTHTHLWNKKKKNTTKE